MSRVLIASSLKERFDLRVVKSNIRDSNAAKGRWDLAGVIRVLSVASRLKMALLFRRPDVVYLTLSQNHSGLVRDLLYISICRFFRVPCVAHLHGSQFPAYLSRRSPALRRFILAGLRNVSVVACGDRLAADLRPIFGDRVTGVPNGTPPEAFIRPAPERNGRRVAYMAHLSQAKGFYDLLEAAPAILERHPDASFHFAGERIDVERNIGGAAPADWSRFEALSRAYPGRFLHAGVVTGADKAAFFAQADVFALPSHAEAFPVALLEAMAAELPVVATPVGAIPEVVSPGINGALVPVTDHGTLAREIIRILENADLRRSMGKSALETARVFSIERQADLIAGVLLSTAGRS